MGKRNTANSNVDDVNPPVTDEADQPAAEGIGESAPSEDEEKTDTPDDKPAESEADQPAADGTGEGAPSENEEKTDTPDDKPAESETEPEKTAYTVHGCNIRHDGKTYKEGSQIELTDEEASRLKKYLKR